MEARAVFHRRPAVSIHPLSGSGASMAEVLKAWGHLLEAEPRSVPGARELPRGARIRQMTQGERERFHTIERVTDASAFLWRLDLMGVDVGPKWEDVADRWDAVSPLDDYPIDAWLAMMAFVGAARERSQRQTLITLKVISLGWGRPAYFAKTCGMAAAQAVLAFGAGRYAETVDLLRPLRDREPPFGWNQVHRDLADQTLIEAAIRSGQDGLASELVGERAVRCERKPAARDFAAPLNTAHA